MLAWVEVSSILLTALSALAALIFVLLLVFLLIPFHLDLEFKKQGLTVRGRYRISWLGITLKKEAIESSPAEDAFASMLRELQGGESGRKGEAQAKTAQGVVESEMRTDKMDEQKTKKNTQAEDAGDEDAEDKPGRDHALPINFGTLLDAFPAIIRVCKDLLKSLSFRKLSCHLCFGLDDPVDTAMMSGYLWAIVSALGLFRANVLISPSFGGIMLEGDFVAEVRARMLWALVALINSLRERKVRTLLREAVRS